MLVISRRPGERIVIPLPDGEIWITMIRNQHDRISVLIDAPDNVEAARGELRHRFQPNYPQEFRISDGFDLWLLPWGCPAIRLTHPSIRFGIEAEIGIDAPPSIRIYREELYRRDVAAGVVPAVCR